MELLGDIAKVYFRVVTILPLLIAMVIVMGKRSIGEMSVVDFLIMMSLGSLFGADVADPGVKQLPTAAAIILIAVLQRLMSTLSIRYHKFGKLVSFEPTVVVHQGKMLVANLRKLRITTDMVLQLLRDKDVFSIEDVETAIIEGNGNLSVLKKAEKLPVIREDLQIVPKGSAYSLPVVIEGRIIQEALDFLQLERNWLLARLEEMRLPLEQQFLIVIDQQQRLHTAEQRSAGAVHFPVQS